MPNAGARGPDPEDPPHDELGGEEEQDDRLEDVDHLDRDLGLDLHQPGAGAHRAEQQAGEEDPDRMGPPEQRDRDARRSRPSSRMLAGM